MIIYTLILLYCTIGGAAAICHWIKMKEDQRIRSQHYDLSQSDMNAMHPCFRYEHGVV